MGEEKQLSHESVTDDASATEATALAHRLYRSLPTRDWFPAAVLLTGLALTLLATYYATRTMQLRARTQFETTALHARDTIRARLAIYDSLLRGTAGFVAVEKEVTKGMFRNFVGPLVENYSGVQGIGFARRVPAPDKDNVAAEMSQQGEEHFHIWPEAERADYYPVTFLEPESSSNQAVIGFDMSSEPTREQAMERARDTGTATASGKVSLLEESETPKHPGFLIYFPVYQGGAVPASVAERRAKLQGFVFSPFRAGDLFTNIFANAPFSIEMQLFDGTNIDSENLLFQSAASLPGDPSFGHVLRESVTLDVSQRTWTARFVARPPWEGAWIVLSLLIGGALLSLAMFYLTRAEGQARRAAESWAARLNASELALRESQESLRRYAAELEHRVAERTANLAQSLQSLEGVLYHVAHDLRAPLRGMASFTNILLEEYAPHLDERGRDYARRVSHAAQRMDTLVQDLLAFGRLAHTAVPLSTINLEHEVNAALDRFSSEIQARGASVEVCSPLPTVKANAAVLNQIISNLLSNALKFVRPDTRPRVRISTEETTSRIGSAGEKSGGTPSLDVKLSALDGKFVRLWIEDNGIGIQPQYHERIFRMFERLHGADSYPGTGIGLAIVRKGIERMGGRVGVESTPGAGSRFWVELPAA